MRSTRWRCRWRLSGLARRLSPSTGPSWGPAGLQPPRGLPGAGRRARLGSAGVRPSLATRVAGICGPVPSRRASAIVVYRGSAWDLGRRPDGIPRRPSRPVRCGADSWKGTLRGGKSCTDFCRRARLQSGAWSSPFGTVDESSPVGIAGVAPGTRAGTFRFTGLFLRCGIRK